MLPLFDLRTAAGNQAFDECLAKLRATSVSGGDAADAVARIIQDVRRDGDDAVVHHMRQWTDSDFSADHIRVSEQDIAAAMDRIDPALRAAIETSIDHVRTYQRHVMPKAPAPITVDGAELGLRFTPVDSVALAVPGGTAALFSTLIMLAVPAMVAGVDPQNIAVLNPPPTRKAGQPVSEPASLVAATCGLLGIKRLYRIGGAQGVAAAALGTNRVQRAELIAGPGNIYVQLAKAQLNGIVGTDGGFYGPSEIVIIADDSADPAAVAADLIAQAEHDPGRCFLVAWSGAVIERVTQQIDKQSPIRTRRPAIEAALRSDSAAILVKDQAAAAEAANAVACEHLNLAVSEPKKLLPLIRHAGEIFLGGATPVAAGDYYAGPSHCLPTATTARFASGVSVYTFLKRTGTIQYRNGPSHETVHAIARLAEAEGLDGHAASVRLRV